MQGLSGFWTDIPPRLKSLFVLISLAIFGLALFYAAGGIALGVIVAVVIGVVLWISRDVWLSPDHSKGVVRKLSIGAALLATLGGPLWIPVVGPELIKQINARFELALDPSSLKQPVSAVAFFFLFGVIFSVNYLMRDRTSIQSPVRPLEEDFPEINYGQRLLAYCNVLREQLTSLDRQASWSEAFFTPLEAEVQYGNENTKKKRKVVGLLNALKQNRSARTFLVLGDPGGGKSSALRKLCRELLDETSKTGRLPIYINLKEWSVAEKWTSEHAPKPEDLYKFIKQQLLGFGEVFSTDFVNTYFDRMVQSGRIFFVFDSFDEIPEVLDEREGSELIDALSRVINTFINGAHASRGVLASRYYRKPTAAYSADVMLEIRPFSEAQLLDYFQRVLDFGPEYVRRVFRERPGFVPSMRNPFLASLMSRYAAEHKGALPGSHAELYDDYITKRLIACAERMAVHRIGSEEVLHGAKLIAREMFKGATFGLEIPLEAVSVTLGKSAEAIVDVLQFGKLARVSMSKEFSFVHRRFCEYFAIQDLLERHDDAPLDSIPADSRWRDALVLYCELALPSEAERIAQFCWSEISAFPASRTSESQGQFLRAVHSLRFLADAFRARLEALEAFRGELSELIQSLLREGDLLAMKIAVEAIGLLRQEDFEEAVVASMRVENSYVRETAVRACRHLQVPTRRLQRTLWSWLDALPPEELLRDAKDLLFSFSLAEGYRGMRRLIVGRTIDVLLCLSGVLIFCIYRVYIGGMVALELVTASGLLFILIRATLPDQGGVGAGMSRFMMERVFILGILVITPAVLLHLGPGNMPRLALWKSWIYTASLFLILPVYPVAMVLLRIEIKRIFVGWRVILVGLIIACVTFGIIVAVILTAKIVSAFWLAVLLSPIGLWAMIRGVLSQWRQWKVIGQLDRSQLHQRAYIMAVIGLMESSWFQRRIVRILEEQVPEATGEWPNGEMPRLNDRVAGARLLRLEEKWMGLS